MAYSFTTPEHSININLDQDLLADAEEDSIWKKILLFGVVLSKKFETSLIIYNITAYQHVEQSCGKKVDHCLRRIK